MNRLAEFSTESWAPNDPEVILDQVSNFVFRGGHGPAYGPFVPPD